MPLRLRDKVDFLLVDVDKQDDQETSLLTVEAIDSSTTPSSTWSSSLRNIDSILWIPSAGKPSADSSDILDRVWIEKTGGVEGGENVKWIHSFAAGVDGIRPFLNKRFVGNSKNNSERTIVTNGRGAFSQSLAEYAMAGVLHFNKQIKRIEQNRVDKKWDVFTMDSLHNKVIGLLGYGSIGKACGNALKSAFGCRVIALRRKNKQTSDDDDDDDGPADEIYGLNEKQTFFSIPDYIICSLPNTPETHHFVSTSEFSSMKSTCVFVSMGRGTVVDQKEMITVLKDRKIGGAVLDVYEKEPLESDSRLWELENVLLTAHNADFTEDYFELGWEVWEDNLMLFLEGRDELSTPVDVSAGY